MRGDSFGLAPDGVWLVELAALVDPALVVQAIAHVLHVPEQPSCTPLEVLQQHLASRRLLLIMDNCEHVVEQCAVLTEQLLLHCRGLRILATSREPLHIPGEHNYLVSPLALPESHEMNPALILSTPAAALFVARIQTRNMPTPVTEGSTLAAIAQICRQLDGHTTGIGVSRATGQQHVAT